MVGHWVLVPTIGVRIPVPQQETIIIDGAKYNLNNVFCLYTSHFEKYSLHWANQ